MATTRDPRCDEPEPITLGSMRYHSARSIDANVQIPVLGDSTMTSFGALIDQLCSKRSAFVKAMAATHERITNEQIRDLAALQSALSAVEAEQRRAEREILHEQVQQRLGSSA
jgi:hypothetical protein